MPDGCHQLQDRVKILSAPKVLMMSAVNHAEVVKGALALGADFYICKPINLSELEHLVNHFCPM